MALEFFVVGCTSHQPDGPEHMPNEPGTWDCMVWTTKGKAMARYNYWKEGNFQSGAMTQMFVARVVMDIFHPGQCKIELLQGDFHQFQKTVVYNKQEEVHTVVKKALSTSTLMNWDKPLSSSYDDEPEEDEEEHE